ncbi:hypothetical protein [Clostridium sp. JNZ J1-5]
MIKTNLLQVSEETVKELDICCFLCSQLENGLAIIAYSGKGQPKRITVEKEFDFTVENNKLKIYSKNKDKAVFILENLSDFDFIDWDEHIKFYSLIDNTVIKIAPASSITEEEDALCIQ